MKREIDVTAYRTVTEFDKDNSLISTVELRVPAEELNYFQDVLRAALLGHWPALAAHLVEVDRLDAESQEGAA